MASLRHYDETMLNETTLFKDLLYLPLLLYFPLYILNSAAGVSVEFEDETKKIVVFNPPYLIGSQLFYFIFFLLYFSNQL